MRLQRRLGAALTLAGLGLVALVTLTPTRDIRGLAAATHLLCLVCGDHGGADVAANLLLFLPLATGLRLGGASWRRTVLMAGLLSFTVELLQLRVIPGRDASLSDLLTNTASGAIGATVGTCLPRAMAPRPSHALALLRGGSLGVLLLLGLSAWLLAPWTPHGALSSRWADQTLEVDAFGGRVRSARLDGRPMPPHGPPPDPAAIRRELAGGYSALAVDLVSGAPARDRLWIYQLRVRPGAALTLSQFRRQAGIAVPARALRFRLLPPMLTLGDAFPDSAGVPVHLEATERSRRLRLASSYGGTYRSVELGISPAFGWTLLVPFELAVGTAVRWVSGLALAAMLLPLGYWAACTRRPAAAIACLGLTLTAALAVLPAAAGLPPVHWSEWLAATLGASAGWALRRPAAYLQGRCASPSVSESSSS